MSCLECVYRAVSGFSDGMDRSGFTVWLLSRLGKVTTISNTEVPHPHSSYFASGFLTWLAYTSSTAFGGGMDRGGLETEASLGLCS